ncbi:MAG TPA: 30S ribosomal protein S6 [Dehalococcoidia bacterium]|nr:30S ribosomal protein S6 [Dehalococcoidia bacterium]
MRGYELVLIIDPEILEEDVPTAIEKVSQFITGRGGEVANVNRWGRRKLAYPIQRHMEGNYVVTQFRLDPEQIAGLEASLGLAEEVIRHLVVRTDED